MNRLLLWNMILFLCAPVFFAASLAEEIAIDFSQRDGVLRPLHGGNMGPLCYRGVVDLSEHHRQLRIPLTRLHDVPWTNFDAVDISTIFRDFRNDPDDPESYDFAPTDDYIAAIVKTGSPILYRLGESIEHTPRKYRVNPPADFDKWARICCGIIRHYNEGWADGFKHGIRYWEIWNEPDFKPAMWTGTDEQSLRLYGITAKAIKSRWPDLKVGGPALANTGKLEGNTLVPSTHMVRFLSYCRDNRIPLDFFSWHRYTNDPSEYPRRAQAVRKVLDEYGFNKTEIHLNEWNYLPDANWTPLTKGGQGRMRQQWVDRMSGPEGAAFDALVLMSLQDTPIDMANFFTADTQMLGMFTDNGVPEKNFYAFKAVRALLDTPMRVKTPAIESGRVAVCAGLSEDTRRASILLSNFNAADGVTELAIRGLPWKGTTRFESFLVDGDHDLNKVREGVLDSDGRLTIPELKAPSVVLLKLAPEAGSR